MSKIDAEKVKVPISPMIDIIFLMIFFFVLSSMVEAGPSENIDLVKVENCKPRMGSARKVYISVNKDGIAQMDDSLPLTKDLLQNSVRRIMNLWGSATVFVVRGDKDALHSDIDSTLSELKEAGAHHIVLTGELKSVR